MSVGHITLDGRPYLLKNPQAYRRYPANQMAPKLGQGQSQYRDLTAWEAWIVENWQAGIGQKAEDEGMRYSEADSRVPNQIVLPPLLRLSDTLDQGTSGALTHAVTAIRYTPVSITNILTVGNAGDCTRVSIYIDATTPPANNLSALWFYLSTRVGITVELFAVDANKLPTGAALTSGVVTPVSQDYAYRWYKAAISRALNGQYAIVLRPTNTYDSFTMGCGATYTAAVTGLYDGAAWAANSTYYPAFFSDVHKINGGTSVADVRAFNGNTHDTFLAAGDSVYGWDADNLQWDLIGVGRSTTVTDLEVVGSTLYVGLGNATNFDVLAAAETFSAGASAGRIFYNAGRYLWKAISGGVYYSSNGTTWSSAIPVGNSAYAVRGIAEVDGDVYAATDDGLFMIAPGDIAVGITPWGANEAGNGVDMFTHQGILYAIVGGQFLQINGGAVRNLWTVRKDELPSWASGKVVSACATLNWPVVVVDPDSSDGFGSVWAWQDQGWHHLALLPQGLTPSVVRYDRGTQKLWIGTSTGLMFSAYVSNYLINPYEDTSAEFAAFGWFETDWFAAGLLEEQKDIESLYVRGRGIDAAQTIKAYWQDDTSTEVTYLVDENGDSIGDESGNVIGDETQQWLYHGAYTVERDEQRWELGPYRPNTKEIKLGFLLASNDSGDTPKLEAHRLKYHVMVRDWWGWDLPLEVSGRSNQYQQTLDGDMQDYTALEQIAHLDSLVRGQVPPVLMTDIDGSVYEVKIEQGSFSPEKVEYFDGALQYYGVYNLQVREVAAR